MSLPTSLWRGEGHRAVVSSVVVVVAATAAVVVVIAAAAGAAVVIVIVAGWGASCHRAALAVTFMHEAW